MSNRLPKLLLLATLAVTIAVAASPVGTVTSTGAVRVSGESLPAQGVPSWPVVSGDEIVTEKGGAAVLSWSSARIEIRERSQVKLGEEDLRLESGAVGADNYSIRFGDYTARPGPQEPSSVSRGVRIKQLRRHRARPSGPSPMSCGREKWGLPPIRPSQVLGKQHLTRSESAGCT